MQDSPTPDAYEAACKALWHHRERAGIYHASFVWNKLLEIMAADNGGDFLLTTADWIQARPAIEAMIEAGFFTGDPDDLDGDYWLAVAGDQSKAERRFSKCAGKYEELSDILDAIFDCPA